MIPVNKKINPAIQAYDMFIKPEILKRQKEGKLPIPFKPTFAQVLLTLKGSEVRIDQEVKIKLDIETKKPTSGEEIVCTDNIKKINGVVPFEEDKDKGQFVCIWTSSNHLVFAWIAHPFYSREKLTEAVKKTLKKETWLIESGRIIDEKPEEQDMVQEKYLHAIKVLDEYTGLIKHPTTYLRKAADNKKLNLEEKEQEQYRDIFVLESSVKYGNEQDKNYDNWDKVASSEPEIETIWALQEEQEAQTLLEDLRNGLTEKENQVIDLRYYKQLTQQEVAKRLRITHQMVSKYEQKAIRKLRKQYSTHPNP